MKIPLKAPLSSIIRLLYKEWLGNTFPLFYTGIYGGHLLGVRSPAGLSFYDWETQELIRRIEIQPRTIFWSETGEMCCITTEDSFFILRYQQDKVSEAMENKDELVTEDGVEDAFEVNSV